MTPTRSPGRDSVAEIGGERAALSATPKRVVRFFRHSAQRGTSGVHVCRLDEMQAQNWS